MKLTDSDKQSLRQAQDAQTKLAKLSAELSFLSKSPELETLNQNRTETLASIRSETGQLDLVSAEAKRLESDIEVVRKRIQRDQGLLQTMSNPKDIAGVEHELKSLAERLDSLETAELESMERVDELSSVLARLEAELSEIDGQITNLESQRRQQAEALQVDLDAQQQELNRALGALSAELVTILQQLWARSSGVGELRDTTCGVCHMGLNSSAINDIKRTPLDELAQCPECRAILLRPGGE